MPVTLQIDPSCADSPKLTIGVLNVIATVAPFPAQISAANLRVLRNVQKMLQAQIRATWDGWTRTRESHMRRIVTDFVSAALVDPGARRHLQRVKSHSTSSKATTVTSTGMARQSSAASSSSTSATGAARTSSTAELGRRAVRQVLDALPQAEMAVLVDLAPLHYLATNARDRSLELARGTTSAVTPKVIARESHRVVVEAETSFESRESLDRLLAFMMQHDQVRAFYRRQEERVG